MRIFDQVKILVDGGMLPGFVRSGFISPSAFKYYQIFQRYEELICKKKRKSKAQIMLQLSEEFDCSISTTYTAINVMKDSRSS